jgi:ribose-phosphate pyrophosphokinase
MLKLSSNKELIPLKQWTFPAGERGIQIYAGDLNIKDLLIEVNFQTSDDIIDLMLLVDACRTTYKYASLYLKIPYFPYARQDRVMNPGESLSLRVIINLINSMNFTEIEIWDPHSEVLTAGFSAGKLIVRTQEEMLFNFVKDLKLNAALVSPDVGALKKIYKLAAKVNLPVIECNKVRSSVNGDITSISIGEISPTITTLVIVDDICDGGATFISIAKEIEEKYGKGRFELRLVVTHGIFSKGKEILNRYFNEISCANEFLQG